MTEEETNSPVNEPEIMDNKTAELEDLIKFNAGQQKMKTQNNIETNTPSSPFLKRILIILFSILTILLLLYIFLPRRPPRSPYLPIPFIVNYRYKKIILKYSSLPSHNQILVVTGPQGIGKTRGLTEISNSILNQTKTVLPINFDFMQINNFSTPKDIKTFLMSSVFNSFSTFDRQINTTLIKQYTPFLDSIQSQQYEYSRSIFKKDTNLAKIYSCLHQSINKGIESEYRNFFYMLNQFSELLNITIIANEPFRFEPFLHFCNEYSKNQMKMGIIFDINNLYDTDILSKHRNIYQIHYIKPFDEKTAKTIFVDKEHVFTKKQFPKLWDNFGGVGSYWAQYYDLIREGYNMNDAIAEIQNTLAMRFIQATNYDIDKKNYSNRVAFLKKLTKRSEVVFSVDEIPMIAHYNRCGLLAPTDQNRIVMTDKMLLAAIKKALKSL